MMPGQRGRQHDLREYLQARGAVDQRRLLDLDRDRAHEGPHQPHAERQRDAHVAEDQAEQRVRQIELHHHQEQREDEDDRRHHVAEQAEVGHQRSAPVAEARQAVGGERRDGDADQRRAERDDHAVDEPAGEELRPASSDVTGRSGPTGSTAARPVSSAS